MEAVMVNIGEKLKTLRISKRYTQDFIANYLNISRSTYANYERNHSFPDYEKLISICKLYDINPNYLLGFIPQTSDKDTVSGVNISNNSYEKIISYYARLSEENQDYIRGEMVKLYREQENDAVENTSEKKIG